MQNFADDTTMILDGSQSSFSRTLYLFDAFGSMSGLKVNYNKMESLWISSFKNSNNTLFSNKQITWAKGKVYTLGAWFSTLEENAFYVNFSEKIERIKNILNSWSARRLTLLGKITIIKSLAVSEIVHVVSSLPTDQGALKEINTLLYDFLWNGQGGQNQKDRNDKKDKIKRTEMINDEKLNFQMVLIYRPPPSTKNKLTIPMFFDDFHKLLDTLDDYYQRPVILAGDFNLHLDKPQDSNVSKFLDILDSANLLQHITTPTHKRGHTLDLLISRAEENLVHDIKVLPDIYSDHRVITSTLNYSKPPITDVLVTYRAVKNIDYNKLQSDIAELFPNPDAFDGLRLETLVTTYHESLSSTYDKYAPIITRSIKYRPHAPWFTNELRNEKREKRRLERRFRKSGLTVHKLMFEAKCADYNNLLEQSKTKYYTSKIDQSDRNQLFRLIDGLFYSRNTALPTYSLLDQLVEEFNEYFIYRINDIRAKLIPNDTLPSFIDRSPSPDLKFTCFIPPSDTQMREILPALTNKTSVLDPMPTHIIKEYSSTLLPVLKNIVTISLAEGLFPESLKTSIIRPKLKKPDLDKETLKNYRPLANTSFLSKVIEKAVTIQTYSYLNTHDLLPNFQSAYRQYHSTETALIRVTNDILVTVDSNVDVVLLLLDLSAAFDTLDHSILLRRLETYFGFTGSVLEWFSSYLRGRSQSVMIGSTTSTSKSLEFGVPQGSILGPLLFILYIAPLQDVIATYSMLMITNFT